MAIDVVARAIGDIRDFVWPPQCLGCDRQLRRDDGVVCRRCRPLLRRLEGPTCPTCALPHEFTESDAETPCSTCRRRRSPQRAGFACWYYEGAVSRSIQRAKYAGEQWRLATLGAEMSGWFRTRVETLRPPRAAVPVRMTAIPMHRSRLRERGFNAAIQLARAARVESPPWLESRWGVLEQVRPTRPQAGLSRGERRRNVRDAFSVRRPERVAGAVWILFDDVCTTGATLAEAAGELVDAGARRVYTIAAARTPRNPLLVADR